MPLRPRRALHCVASRDSPAFYVQGLFVGIGTLLATVFFILVERTLLRVGSDSAWMTLDAWLFY